MSGKRIQFGSNQNRYTFFSIYEKKNKETLTQEVQLRFYFKIFLENQRIIVNAFCKEENMLYWWEPACGQVKAESSLPIEELITGLAAGVYLTVQ